MTSDTSLYQAEALGHLAKRDLRDRGQSTGKSEGWAAVSQGQVHCGSPEPRNIHGLSQKRRPESKYMPARKVVKVSTS